MFRRLATALGGTLVLFHGWLLAGQVWDGELSEPDLILRWMVAAGLVTAFAAHASRHNKSSGKHEAGLKDLRQRRVAEIELAIGPD